MSCRIIGTSAHGEIGIIGSVFIGFLRTCHKVADYCTNSNGGSNADDNLNHSAL